MELALIVLKALLKMVLLLLIGIVATKAGVLNEERCRVVTDIIMKILLPCMVVSSFFGGYDDAKLHGLLFALLLSAIAMLLCVVLSRILIPRSEKYPNYLIDRGIAAFPNVGFIGIPLIMSLYGEEGVLYVAMFIGIYNLVQWAYGEPDISGNFSASAVLSTFKQPVMIASILGLVLFFLRLPIPEFISGTVSNIGSCCSTIPMIVIGSSLARCDLKSIVRKPRSYYVLFVKQIVMPAAMILAMKFFDLPEIVKVSMLIPMACPAATSTAMLSIKYGLDDSYAAALTGFGTILSVVTIPLMVMLYSALG